MAQTEAQKRAKNKYDTAHYTIVGCKVRKEYAEQFRVACYNNGTTPATVIKQAIDSYLINNTPENASSVPAASAEDTTP